MAETPPSTAHSAAISQRLLQGYQFSSSDRMGGENGTHYGILSAHFDWFKTNFAQLGFTLVKDDEVIFVEKVGKQLSMEEKQIIVVLFLLTDLWMERGGTYADLFDLRIAWRELDWFRDGYGREYLAQVNISPNNGLTALEDLWNKMQRRGMAEYDSVTSGLTLRRPSERLINMARQIYNQINALNSMQDQEEQQDESNE